MKSKCLTPPLLPLHPFNPHIHSEYGMEDVNFNLVHSVHDGVGGRVKLACIATVW